MSQWPVVRVGSVDVPYDPVLGVYCVYALVPRPQIVFYKILIESYETLGVARSLEPHYRPGWALTCMLAVPDSMSQVVRVYDEMAEQIELQVVEPNDAMRTKAHDDIMIDGSL